ncbi:hypothetical protein BsWGS_17350 [Bradybaena similaris]
MHRLNGYIILAMFMSLLWGIFVLVVGCVLRYGQGQLIASYVKDVEDYVSLYETINSVGINICPIEKEPTNDIKLGEWSIVIGSLVMMDGALIIGYSIIGFLGAILNSKLVMVLLLLLIGLVCSLEYYIFEITTDIYSKFHESAQTELVDILQANYVLTPAPNMFTGTFNAIMLQTQCCGIVGPADFRNLTFNDGKNTFNFTVSPACCKRAVFKSEDYSGFVQLKDCATTGQTEVINTAGCYSEVFNYVANNYGTLIIAALLVLVTWQAVQVSLIIMLLLTPTKPKEASSVRLFPEFQMEKMSHKRPKRFVPHAKPSSFVSSDLQRIRSTEIW